MKSDQIILLNTDVGGIPRHAKPLMILNEMSRNVYASRLYIVCAKKRRNTESDIKQKTEKKKNGKKDRVNRGAGDARESPTIMDLLVKVNEGGRDRAKDETHTNTHTNAKDSKRNYCKNRIFHWRY